MIIPKSIFTHPMSRGEPTDEKLVQDYTSKLYPKRYSKSGFLYHSRITTAMLDRVKFRDGRYSDKILDVGCGTGLVSQLYPNFDVTGVDISDGMLAQNPYHWIKAPAEALPFGDNTFDFVVCRSLLHHLNDPRIGLKEMFRVLKSGGEWSCWDPHHGIVYNFIRSLFQHTDRFSHLHKSFSDKELFSLIEDSGFEITEERYIGYLGYPLLGFPDIFDFHIPLSLARKIIRFDELLERTFLKKLSWSLMVKARKS